MYNLFDLFSRYDLCPMFEEGDLADTLCSGFPEGNECGCPLLAGEYNFTDVTMEIADLGEVFGSLLEVINHTIQYTVVDYLFYSIYHSILHVVCSPKRALSRRRAFCWIGMTTTTNWDALNSSSSLFSPMERWA